MSSCSSGLASFLKVTLACWPSSEISVLMCLNLNFSFLGLPFSSVSAMSLYKSTKSEEVFVVYFLACS